MRTRRATTGDLAAILALYAELQPDDPDLDREVAATRLTGSSDPATHAFYRACGFDGDAKTGYLVRG